MPKIAFATYDRAELKTEEPLAKTELDRFGIHVDARVWNDSAVKWDQYDAVIIRSCWDYHLHPHQFLSWVKNIKAAGIPLWNPPAVIQWNMEKTYLSDLERKGIPIVGTRWFTKNEKVSLTDIMKEKSWTEAVVKPTISASGYNTWRTSQHTVEDGCRRLDDMLKSSGVMVQTFVPEICTEGEWSLLYFNGKFSHAILKKPKQGDFRVQHEYGGSIEEGPATVSMLKAADMIIDAVGTSCLYARVDGVMIGGRFTLMELELIEPYLFLPDSHQAAFRFATAIKERLEEFSTLSG